MSRRDPPPLAAWMLEHCVPSGRAAALADDLLKSFRSCGSDSWYWRKVLSACAVSWAESFRARLPLLLFALLWSMAAPAWKIFVDGIDVVSRSDRILRHLGPFWIFPALAGWVVLHSIFLWAGILVYFIAHASLGKDPRSGKLRRALLLAPLVFTPLYGATFLWANLYWYSFFANTKLATTPLGQFADFQTLANVMRLPFFIALLWSLWSLIPQSRHTPQTALVASPPTRSSTHSASPLAPNTLRPFLILMVGAGLVNAMIAAFILCRLPASHAPTLEAVLTRAILYVALGAVAGIFGTYLYWVSPANPFRTDPPLPFPLFALVCAAGWVWVPAMAIFSDQFSGATALVAGIGAFFLAVGLRHSTFFLLAPATKLVPTDARREFALFAEPFIQPRWEAHGYIIAISLFASLMALATHQNFIAAVLLACSSALFAWKHAFVASFETSRVYGRSATRLALVAIPAVLVTVWALLDGIAHRDGIGAASDVTALNALAAQEDSSQQSQSQSARKGASGYESLILWPFPEKKPIIPPTPTEQSFLAPGTTQPLIIRFDGPYWYLQPPEKRPGPNAHQAHGTPLGAAIRSTNDLPLVMDAHQPLGASIPIARCREIEVEIENHDDHPGSVAMAVLLTDGSAAGKSELYLGQQPIPAAEAGPSSIEPAPPGDLRRSMNVAGAMQSLHFAIPAVAKIRKFNEITVMMLPDTARSHEAPKIAVREFELMPR
jgi:hypothetical protein